MTRQYLSKGITDLGGTGAREEEAEQGMWCVGTAFKLLPLVVSAMW
jgi:hypothetical protein